MEGGIIHYWLDDVNSAHLRKKRSEKERREEKGERDDDIFEVRTYGSVVGKWLSIYPNINFVTSSASHLFNYAFV